MHFTTSQNAFTNRCSPSAAKILPLRGAEIATPCGARYSSWGKARRNRRQVRTKSTKIRSSSRRFRKSRSCSTILRGAGAATGNALGDPCLGSSGFCRCTTLQAGRGLSHARGWGYSLVSVSLSPLSSPPSSPPPLRLRTRPCTRGRFTSRRPTPRRAPPDLVALHPHPQPHFYSHLSPPSPPPPPVAPACRHVDRTAVGTRQWCCVCVPWLCAPVSVSVWLWAWCRSVYCVLV